MKTNNFDEWLQQAKKDASAHHCPNELDKKILDSVNKPRFPKPFTLSFSNQPRKIAFSLSFAIAAFVVLFIVKDFSNPEMLTVNEAIDLAKDINKEVYKAQKQYETAIHKMEKLAFASIDKDNANTKELDQLHALNLQIIECKVYLEQNPYYPEIHGQLITAYQQKIDLLNKLITQSKEKLS